MNLIKGSVYKIKYGSQYIRLLYSFPHSGGKALKFRIMGENNNQAIWIPKSQIKLIGKTEIAPIDWFWNKQQNKYKLELSQI